MQERRASHRRSAPRGFRTRRVGIAIALVLFFGAPLRSGAQSASPLPGGTGGIEVAAALQGRVQAGGAPLGGATVMLTRSQPSAAGEAPAEMRISDVDGVFEFGGLEPGVYRLEIDKKGYEELRREGLALAAGQSLRLELELGESAPVAGHGAEPSAEPDDGLGGATPEPDAGIESFVVEASPLEEILASLDLRLESDQMLNVMDADDLSQFAAGDVADALKRISGVNVVEGQFAIIRGMEERYSSTLFNGAPVPSPDPDKQSVQLDLFPSEIVGNLVVSKTFAPDLPSNSAGGAIDVVTQHYPEELAYFQLKGGTGYNDNATDRFLAFRSGSPIGDESDQWDALESEYGGVFGSRAEIFDRELRLKVIANREIDYESEFGWQEGREPRTRKLPGENPPNTNVFQSGGLSLGRLDLSNGRYDLTTSERAEQETGYAGLGFDLDPEGQHRIDLAYFTTEKSEETVQFKENGFLPNFDYQKLVDIEDGGDTVSKNDFTNFSTLGSWISRTIREDRGDSPSRGPLWFTNFSESKSLDRKRDLEILQVNGDHVFDGFLEDHVGDLSDGLHVSWAANRAETTQSEEALGARIFFEPDDEFQPASASQPTAIEDLGPGLYAATPRILSSQNEIEETQDFFRIDGDYERDFFGFLTLALGGGYWSEQADRDVESGFLETPSVQGSQCNPSPNCTGSLQQFALTAGSLQELGEIMFGELSRNAEGVLNGLRLTGNESSREIDAWNLHTAITLWEDFDLLGGMRFENIYIESLNDPFTGQNRFGAPDIFPTRYLFFDRLDNPAFGEVAVPPPSSTVFNDQILGVAVPIGVYNPGKVDLRNTGEISSMVNGVIDEDRQLPALGVAYRPIEGLSLRGAYSETVARPSFREMGYYVSVETGSDDLIVGNPQLGLSDVTSWDARAEYVWGDYGDLVAISLFYKTIDAPIESLVVRDPTNAELSSSALYRTFFNNPNQAEVRGIEGEARKSLGFLGHDFLDYFTLGGNLTYIDAEVDRTEAELARSTRFFGLYCPGGVCADDEEFDELESSRRLYNQPEWIANADLTFHHPDWGTQLTLAFFAISDVLDAAGSASIGPNGSVIAYTLDRYVDSFYQVDLVFSQSLAFDIPLPGSRVLPSSLDFKFSAKNLTDSVRRILYDPYQTTDRVEEREYRVGRDYAVGLTLTITY